MKVNLPTKRQDNAGYKQFPDDEMNAFFYLIINKRTGEGKKREEHLYSKLLVEHFSV